MDHHTIKRSLAGSGLRSTPQRYAVMAFLTKHEGHPTAAEIFAAVNRLDRLTSGLMILALSGTAARDLAFEFQEGKVKKEYVARVRGEFPE